MRSMRKFYLDSFNKITYFNIINSYQTGSFYEDSLKELIEKTSLLQDCQAYKLMIKDKKNCEQVITEKDLIIQLGHLLYPQKVS